MLCMIFFENILTIWEIQVKGDFLKSYIIFGIKRQQAPRNKKENNLGIP